MSIFAFKGTKVHNFLDYDIYLLLKIVSVLASSAYPNAAFHLGLHCLPNKMFAGYQNKKGYLTNNNHIRPDMYSNVFRPFFPNWVMVYTACHLSATCPYPRLVAT